MSILKKLSSVLREVFWIKSSNRSKSTVKKTPKKSIKKTKITKPKKVLVVKASKTSKSTKPAKLSAVLKSKKFELDPNLAKVGEITHYFNRIKVCVVKITHGTVLIGDKLTIVGEKTKFVQKVWSMQVESQDVKVAKKGQLIGLKIDKLAAVGDIVYK